MGVRVLERRSAVNVPRRDAVALHGMGRNMFSTIPAIRDSQSFEEMAEEMLKLSDQKLNKKDPCWATQHEDQLRIITFIKAHGIK